MLSCKNFALCYEAMGDFTVVKRFTTVKAALLACEQANKECFPRSVLYRYTVRYLASPNGEWSPLGERYRPVPPLTRGA